MWGTEVIIMKYQVYVSMSDGYHFDGSVEEVTELCKREASRFITNGNYEVTLGNSAHYSYNHEGYVISGDGDRETLTNDIAQLLKSTNTYINNYIEWEDGTITTVETHGSERDVVISEDEQMVIHTDGIIEQDNANDMGMLLAFSNTASEMTHKDTYINSSNSFYIYKDTDDKWHYHGLISESEELERLNEDTYKKDIDAYLTKFNTHYKRWELANSLNEKYQEKYADNQNLVKSISAKEIHGILNALAYQRVNFAAMDVFMNEMNNMKDGLKKNVPSIDGLFQMTGHGKHIKDLRRIQQIIGQVIYPVMEILLLMISLRNM